MPEGTLPISALRRVDGNIIQLILLPMPGAPTSDISQWIPVVLDDPLYDAINDRQLLRECVRP